MQKIIFLLTLFVIGCTERGHPEPKPTTPCPIEKEAKPSPEKPEPKEIRVNICLNGDVKKGDYSVSQRAVKTIAKAGGNPIHITPGFNIQHLPRDCDGVILTGGADINSARYKEAPTLSELMDKRRENFDFAIAGKAIAEKIPLLGICLGMQEIWVTLGGTLIQDIPSETSGKVDHRKHHEVFLRTETRLYSIFQTNTLSVYSNHHQALDHLDRHDNSLKITAEAAGGIVEAIESPDPDRFLIGVGWHPERTQDDLNGYKLFEAMIRWIKNNNTRPTNVL